MPWSRVLEFGDPLACQAAIQAAQAELIPTARGPFHAEITQIGMNRVWMQRFDFGLPLVISAKVNSDRKAIGFLSEGSSPVHHCGIELSCNDIFLTSNDVWHQRTETGCRYATLSVPVEDFPDLCRTVAGREFLEAPGTSIVRPDRASMSRLMKLHKTIGRVAQDTPDILLMPEVLRALESELVRLMVRCIAEGADVQPTSGDLNHAAVMLRFEEFLAAHPDRPLYITQICEAIGVSERTLRNCCHEHLGMGPIRFLTLRRMHLLRRALLRADRANTTVTRIVTEYGFWELGRLSMAYRALFEELPSDTLRRPAEDYPAIPPNRPSSFSFAEKYRGP